jgi:hypothetical protein
VETAKYTNHTKNVITQKQKRRTPVVLAVAGSLILGCAVLWGVFFRSWDSRLSHWPHVPPAEYYVTSQPKLDGIPGRYRLIQQTVNKQGLAILDGRECVIELHADGTFVATNYPQWLQSSATPEFISTTGRWSCETIPVSYNGHSCYGIVFSESGRKESERIAPLALRSDGSPYNLMLDCGGDPDEGKVMTFGKQ